MSFLFKLAILNVGRNPRRSVITVLAVSVGLAALIFLWGFNDATIEQMRENVIRLFTGHAQVHAAGFEKTLAPELTIPDRIATIEKLRALPQVQDLTERVKCEALVGTTENSRGVLLMGLDPEREQAVTELETHIAEGEFLASGDDRRLLLGDRLAKKIKAEVGDKVVVMTQAMDGTLAGFAYRVKGLLHTGSRQLDEVTAYITLDSARELLSLDAASHEIVLRLDSRESLPAFRRAAASFLDTKRFEVQEWSELVPEVEQWSSWAEAVVSTILIAVTIVIVVGVMNTVLMSIFERTRELGVMLAIGTSPAQIVKLVLLETLVLECIGMLIGLAAGYAVTSYFGQVGIHFSGVEEAFSNSYMSTVVYTAVETHHVIESIVTLFILTAFVGLYPAWKAAQMEPVKAIYHSA